MGILEESYSDRLCGLAIRNKQPDQCAGKPVATLSGQLADQADLFGVLNALDNRRMPLLVIEYMIEQGEGVRLRADNGHIDLAKEDLKTL